MSGTPSAPIKTSFAFVKNKTLESRIPKDKTSTHTL